MSALHACAAGVVVRWRPGHQAEADTAGPQAHLPLAPLPERSGFLEQPPAAFPWEPWGGWWVSVASLAATLHPEQTSRGGSPLSGAGAEAGRKAGA